ncbi:hypothetical protein MTBPR1_60106 [Candidatus Terasakiella magnetica]|uniref:Uncharacterized protein n=1 Tax=Candidatus Terasakiella magnetica TaxID=1867952 RepID=A0A1C3RK44_9PROT|nr:hypothetical protein MTBPR1_60106 [Candidatus Terasakiella magnetica]
MPQEKDTHKVTRVKLAKTYARNEIYFKGVVKTLILFNQVIEFGQDMGIFTVD